MITLEEHNKQITKKYSTGTGIECPKCKEELHNESGMILTSDPPKQIIYCKNCNFSTTIII